MSSVNVMEELSVCGVFVCLIQGRSTVRNGLPDCKSIVTTTR